MSNGNGDSNGNGLPSPASIQRARELQRQVREMDEAVMGATAFSHPTGEVDADDFGDFESPLTFDERSNWSMMNPYQKRAAFTSGEYGDPDPTTAPVTEGSQRAFLTDDMTVEQRLRSSMGPAIPRARRGGTEGPAELLDRYRANYGSSVIRTNANGEEEVNQGMVSTIEAHRARTARAPSLITRRQGPGGEYEGIQSREEQVREVLTRRDTHIRRRAEMQMRILEHREIALEDLGRYAQDMVTANEVLIWQEQLAEIERLAAQSPSQIESVYAGTNGYSGQISSMDLFPHLAAEASSSDEDVAQAAIANQMYLMRHLPRGVPTEFIEAESDASGPIDRDHDLQVVNMQVIASIIAEARINAEMVSLPIGERPRAMNPDDQREFRASRIDEYEEDAMRRLNEIRRVSDGTHYALFDPDGMSLRQVLDQRSSQSYAGSVVDAWWHGSGTDKSSTLYEQGQTFMVEHEGLLDWAWRGVPGLAFGAASAISEERSIIDIYQGAGFGDYSEEVGYGLVDMYLGVGRIAGISDVEPDAFPNLVAGVGGTWAVAQTIASPDLITMATFGLGAVGRAGSIAGATRAFKTEGLASAAEEVVGVARMLRQLRAGASGGLSSMAGTEEVALAAARGRYLVAEGGEFMSKLGDLRIQAYRSAGSQAAALQDEAAEVQAMMDRIEKVLGKPTADAIRTQYQSALASNTTVGAATHRATQKAISAEARLQQGVRPLQVDEGARTAQAASQTNRGRFAPGGGRVTPQPTTGVTRGGLPAAPTNAPSSGGRPLPLNPQASSRVPVGTQDDAINLVRWAVENGKTVWESLKGQINPLTKKPWTPGQRGVVAQLELAANEAAHISLSGHAAELRARRTILQSFAGKMTGTVSQVKTAAQNARRALDDLRALRQELHGLENTSAVRGSGWVPGMKGSSAQIDSLNKAVEKARKAADAALEHYGRTVGKASHGFLDSRIANAERLASETGAQLQRLSSGIAKELGKTKKYQAGLHNAERHAKEVAEIERLAQATYTVPGYRIFGNIVKEMGESNKALAQVWATPAWRKTPTFRGSVARLKKAGFLGTKAPDTVKDVGALQKKLTEMFDLSVLERVALRNTPEAAELRAILKFRTSKVLPSRPPRASKNALARNIETLTKESRDLLIAERGGAQAAAVAVATAELAFHSPKMVRGLITGLGARVYYSRVMQGTIHAFAKPFLNKVGWGNAELTDIMKGIENLRKTHAQRLTHIAISGSMETRSARIASFMGDVLTDGASVTSNGLTFLRRAINSKDEQMMVAVDKLLQQISHAFIPSGGLKGTAFKNSDVQQITMLEARVKAAIGSGEVKTFDDLLQEVMSQTGKFGKGTSGGAREAIAAGEKPTRAAFRQLHYSESMVAQSLLTAASLEIGTSRMASLTAHLSDDALRGLASLQRGDMLNLTATFKEISEVSARLGIPMDLQRANQKSAEALRMGIQLVEKDGGVTFLNQRLIDSVVDTIKGTIKSSEKYYREAPMDLGAGFVNAVKGVWTNVLRFMTTGLFHIGYYSNMTVGNFSQTFAEAGLGAALAVGASASVGMITPALTKIPVIGPRLISKYEKLAAFTLPHPMMSLLDARTSAVMNMRMLPDSALMTLPSGEKITMGAYRTELQMAGAFDGLTASIAPTALYRDQRAGFLERMSKGHIAFKPSKVISKPLEMSANLFNHMEVVQRISLYNYLRLNKGMSKARSGQVMRNSLYDWNFATVDAERWYSSFIMFFNFHKLSIGRGLDHALRPAVAGRGLEHRLRGGLDTVGGTGIWNSIARTSPLHPDAYASARINMYDRVHKEYVEDPALEAAGVERPGWAARTHRTFAGGGQLTKEDRLRLMEITGRDATDWVESLPAPTPQSVAEMVYGLAFQSIRLVADDSVDLGDWGSAAAKELAGKSNPAVRTFLAQYIDNFGGELDSDRMVKLYSPTHRTLARLMETIPGLAGVGDINYEEDPEILDIIAGDPSSPAAMMYAQDRPYTMRVPAWKAAVLALLTLPLSRKLDPIYESGAFDTDAMEAAEFWVRQNAGVYKRHYTNPVQEQRYKIAAFDAGVQEELQTITNEMPGGVVLDDSTLMGPSMERYQEQLEAATVSDRIRTRNAQMSTEPSVESIRAARYRSRVMREE